MSEGEAAARAHVSVNVSDLARAVRFYRALFGVEPAVHQRDYAKFELDEPALVLSLEPVFHPGADAFNHLGVRFSSRDAVLEAQKRVCAAGLEASHEDGVECCYSQQSKLWVADPDKNLWELYAVTGELEHRGNLSVSDALAARDRAHVRDRWEHRLGEPVPYPLPHEDSSLDEVALRGTGNGALSVEVLERLFAEVFRVLRPGGQVVMHGLASDRVLEGGFPKLPGPAALVRGALVEREPQRLMEGAGFVALLVQKLSEGPNFTHAGVQMRELLLSAWKPAAPLEGDEVVLVYKGPFREARDDEGTVFRRGERVTVSARAAATLRLGPLQDQFHFLRTRVRRVLPRAGG